MKFYESKRNIKFYFTRTLAINIIDRLKFNSLIGRYDKLYNIEYYSL